MISFCVFWFFIHLVIESTMLPLEMIFEHRLYLPLFGIAVGASYLLFLCLSTKLPLAVFLSVIVANEIARDGESNWLEGVQLLAVYILLGLVFFFLPDVVEAIHEKP